MVSAAGKVKLSAHFSLWEFGMDDGHLPPPNSVFYLITLCEKVLEPMRARFGVCTVTSGYRTTSHNALVGGARDSRHLYDVHPTTPAVDVAFRTGTPEQWTAMAITMRVGGVGTYKRHVHLDRRRNRARWTG